MTTGIVSRGFIEIWGVLCSILLAWGLSIPFTDAGGLPAFFAILLWATWLGYKIIGINKKVDAQIANLDQERARLLGKVLYTRKPTEEISYEYVMMKVRLELTTVRDIPSQTLMYAVQHLARKCWESYKDVSRYNLGDVETGGSGHMAIIETYQRCVTDHQRLSEALEQHANRDPSPSWKDDLPEDLQTPA